jgi:hypothetical protein
MPVSTVCVCLSRSKFRELRVTSDEKSHCEVRSWLMGLDTDFCSGMGNLVERWKMCLKKYGHYVEK